jgi:pilus assembly protein FimV
MAKKEGEPTLDDLDILPEEEDVALFDDEPDAAMSSAGPQSEGSDTEESLDQYGVWVKVEPQTLQDAELDLDLGGLESGEGSSLTDEEEQLLGELETEGAAAPGDLSGLEEDLEALDSAAPSAAGGEEELSLEELDMDLEDIGELSPLESEDAAVAPGPGGEELSDLELSPSEAEGLTSELEKEGEIEVPLSDRAAVEEHYEGLAAVEGVPSRPGSAPVQPPADVLEKIERDLHQIRAEIQSLKTELAGMGRIKSQADRVEVKPAPAPDAGFFQKGEDETIALTGDELDNILNTADITEEQVAESVSEEIEELPELPGEEAAPLEEILPPGGLELEPEALGESALGESGAAGTMEEIEIEIGKPEAKDSAPAELEDFPDLEGLGELGEQEPLQELEALEEELGSDAEPSALEPVEELEGLEEVGGLEALEGLEEPTAEAGEEIGELAAAEELPEVELEALPEMEVAEELEALPEIEAAEPEGQEPEPGAEAVEELEAEAEGAEELEALPEIEAVEELGAPEAELGAEEELEAPTVELGGEIGGELGVAEELEAAPPVRSAVMSEDLRSDIRSVLSYLDQLLEALPEEKIREFAQSEYFNRYKRLFEELGLGA